MNRLFYLIGLDNLLSVIKKLNFDMKQAGEKRFLQLNEMDEFRLQSYENAKLYKE